MTEIGFWIFCTFYFWLEIRPGMVEWWRNRGLAKQDLNELRNVNCVEDMFGDKQ